MDSRPYRVQMRSRAPAIWALRKLNSSRFSAESIVELPTQEQQHILTSAFASVTHTPDCASRQDGHGNDVNGLAV
jgi:hypothetical protein